MNNLEIIPISDLTIMMEPTEIVKIAVGELNISFFNVKI